MRERIARQLAEWYGIGEWGALSLSQKSGWLVKADRLIALMPSVGEIQKGERERIVELYTLHHETQSPSNLRKIMLGEPLS